MANNKLLIQLDLGELGLEKMIKNQIEQQLNQINLSPKQTPKEENPVLTRKQAAKYLNISIPTLHKRTKSGEINAYRLGSRVMYKLEELNSVLKPIRLPRF